MRKNSLAGKNGTTKIKKNTAYFAEIPAPAMSFEEYIEFVTVINEFSNHALKPFKRIEGKHFKM